VRKSTTGIKSDILKWEKASQSPVGPILTEAPVYHVKRVHEDCPQRVFSPHVVFLYPLERTFFGHRLSLLWVAHNRTSADFVGSAAGSCAQPGKKPRPRELVSIIISSHELYSVDIKLPL
jgi:hypothetical protein